MIEQGSNDLAQQAALALPGRATCWSSSTM
jgi:hypothetical protein